MGSSASIMKTEELQTIIRFVRGDSGCGQSVPQTGDILLCAILTISIIACIVCVSGLIIKRLNLLKASNINSQNSLSKPKTNKLFAFVSVIFAVIAITSSLFIFSNNTKAQADSQISLTPTVNAAVSDCGEISIDQAFLSSLKGIELISVDTTYCDGISPMDDVSWKISTDNAEIYNGAISGHKDLTSVFFARNNKINFSINGMSKELAKSLIGKDVALIKLTFIDTVAVGGFVSGNNIDKRIEGASLEFKTSDRTYNCLSGKNGFFSMELPKDVAGTWTINAEGYETFTKDATYTNHDIEYFRLTTAANIITVKGNVYNDDIGEGIEGVSLKFSTSDKTYECTSGQYGGFSVELPKNIAGTWIINAKDCKPFTKEAVYGDDSTEYFRLTPIVNDTLTFHIQGKGHLEISYDGQNWEELSTETPLKFTQNAGYSNGNGKGTMIITSAKGFRICKVRAVAYSESTFAGWNVSAGPEKHIITGNDIATATFKEDISINVEVKDSKTFDPIQVAQVKFDMGTEVVPREEETDESGSAVIKIPYDTEGVWSVSFMGYLTYKSEPISYTVSTPLEVSLEKSVFVSGNVKSGDSNDAIVGANLSFKVGDEQLSKTYETISDGSGWFTIELPKEVEGTWTVSAKGYETSTKVATYTDTTDESFSLTPAIETVAVGGFVCENNINKRIAGASLEFKTNDKTYSCTSEKDGCFSVKLPKDVAGTWTINAEGYETFIQEATYSSIDMVYFYLTPVKDKNFISNINLEEQGFELTHKPSFCEMMTDSNSVYEE